MNTVSERLKEHISICKSNLKNPLVKRCAKCPFEEIICFHYPEMKQLFNDKRKTLGIHSDIEGLPCSYEKEPPQ